MKGWIENALQFALHQQDLHGCNMHFRNMDLHRGPREMRENNSIAVLQEAGKRLQLNLETEKQSSKPFSLLSN